MYQKVYGESLRARNVLLVVYQSIYMILCTVFTCGHFKHEGDAQQSLLSFSVGHHLARHKKKKAEVRVV